jgi:Tol biopolymer transport system component
VLLLTTLAVGAVLYRKWDADEGRPIRFQVALPEKSNFVSPDGGDLGANSGTLSPDGRYLTFAATDADGKPKLWVRALDSTSAQPLSGTEDPSFPFWSFDSRYIAFFAEGKLKKVQLGGSLPETICDAPRPRGGAGNSDNVIVFAPNNPGALFRVSAAGGVPAAVTKMDESRKERSHRWPYFLPDKTHFLYLALGSPDENTGVWVGSLGSDPPKRLFSTLTNVVYNSGRLLFLRDNALMAQPFNLSKLESTGEPVRIADQIASEPSSTGGGYGLAAFSVSEHGELSYRSGAAVVKTQLTWLDRQGRLLGTVGPVGDYWNPAISPDGRQIAVEKRDLPNKDIWILDLARGTETRFTFYAGVDTAPLWSADGKRIAWESARDGIGQIYVKEAAGVGEEKLLLESQQNKAPVDWAPDNTLFYVEFDARFRFHIKKLTYPGDAKPSPVLDSKFQERSALAALSPDGHWLAYVSNESGNDEVYIQTYPITGSKWQISTNNGAEIRWRRDGKELFYMTGRRHNVRGYERVETRRSIRGSESEIAVQTGHTDLKCRSKLRCVAGWEVPSQHPGGKRIDLANHRLHPLESGPQIIKF